MEKFKRGTVQELIDVLEYVKKEGSVDGEIVNSHKLPFQVVIEDREDSYELVGFEPTQLNCGCWDGIRLWIKKQ